MELSRQAMQHHPSTRSDAMPAGAAPGVPSRDAYEVPPLTFARLWDNPCWLSGRFNIVAMCFNVPVYGWIQETHGLSRPEYVVVFSVALRSEATASEISQSTGFPKNTLSRAVNRMVVERYISRASQADDKRLQTLRLTAKGRALIESTVPAIAAFETEIMADFSADERQTLSEMMSRLAIGALRAAQSHAPNGKG
jgi:MarR family transcriptional regulator, temperature-dependent positive regulator of motility